MAIARAVVGDPALVLADEPTAHLDQPLTETFLRFIDDLRNEGRTVIVATHDPAFTAWGRADRVVRLAHGRVVEP